jgi:hypothetical protein
MDAIFTYSYIDSKNKVNKVSTHPIKSIKDFTDFVLANKDYIIWANLMDVVNGDVVEQYINIKNYPNSGLDALKLVIKGNDADIYRKVYVIHRMEFQEIISFIKKTKIDFYNRLVAEKAFRSLKLSDFFKRPIADQFLVFPADIYDLIMGEFATMLNSSDMSNLEELLPIAKELYIDIEETV